MIDNKIYREWLETKNLKELQSHISKENEMDIALFIEELEPEAALVVYRLLPKDIAAIVFSSISSESQQDLISVITDEELAHIMDDMFLDDAVDLIENLQEEMPALVVNRVLAQVGKEQRDLINKFLQYPKDSAGSLMTIEYIKLNSTITVADAFVKIKKTGLDKETIYTCYVTDDSRHLIGYVSVRTLLLSNPEEIIADIMDTNVIYTSTFVDQEDVAHVFEKYDFMSLPVVDNENRLVGIITVDDMIDAIHQEATEDFQKMAAMSPSDKPYLKSSVVELSRHRIAWLMVLMIGGLITGTILQKYEEAIAAIPLLVSFVPMLTDTGGNSGSQSSTLIIRGLALKEIMPTDLLTVIWKELRVGVLCGGALALANFAVILIRYSSHPNITRIGMVVSLSIWFIVILSKSVGAVLPIAAGAFKMDPAIMAGPLITTVVDAVGLIVYFNLATAILGNMLVTLNM